MVSALATKIRTSDAVLDAQAIGNACRFLISFSQHSDTSYSRGFAVGILELVTRFYLCCYRKMNTDDRSSEDMIRQLLDGLSQTENVLIETIADKTCFYTCFYTSLVECMYYFVKDRAKYMVKDFLQRNKIYSRVVYIAENILKIDLQHHLTITAVLAL